MATNRRVTRTEIFATAVGASVKDAREMWYNYGHTSVPVWTINVEFVWDLETGAPLDLDLRATFRNPVVANGPPAPSVDDLTALIFDAWAVEHGASSAPDLRDVDELLTEPMPAEAKGLVVMDVARAPSQDEAALLAHTLRNVWCRVNDG